MGGSCWGGNPVAVYQKLRHTGLPDESCAPYTGSNKEVFDIPECEDIDICKSCTGSISDSKGDIESTCRAVSNFKLHYVSGYNIFSGHEDIKKEVVSFGPVSCGMKVTAAFKNYTRGIYEESSFLPITNHIISIVGFGTENSGEKYWIVKNTFGTYWGEDGFFRIRMHRDNLGIETYCSSGYPSYELIKSEVRYEGHSKENDLVYE